MTCYGLNVKYPAWFMCFHTLQLGLILVKVLEPSGGKAIFMKPPYLGMLQPSHSSAQAPVCFLTVDTL